MPTLDGLHKEIGSCNRCSLFTIVRKNPVLARGAKSVIMVIGIAPGNTETTGEKAFSGPAGKKLLSWLKEANIDVNEESIRKQVYFTSLIKCFPSSNAFDDMFANCFSFLKDQLSLVEPKILLTLGSEPFNKLFGQSQDLKNIVGAQFRKETLFTPSFFEDDIFTSVSYVIPFPHPSGLSRWLNNDHHKKLLGKAINILEKTNKEIKNEQK